ARWLDLGRRARGSAQDRAHEFAAPRRFRKAVPGRRPRPLAPRGELPTARGNLTSPTPGNHGHPAVSGLISTSRLRAWPGIPLALMNGQGADMRAALPMRMRTMDSPRPLNRRRAPRFDTLGRI